MNYTNRERTDMHFCYGLANGSNYRAQRLYQRRHPNRRIPHPQLFARIHRQLSEHGTFSTPRLASAGRVFEADYDDIRDEVLRRVAQGQSISTRRLAAELNVARMTIWRILNAEGLYPYHLQRVQALYPGDQARRIAFCRWFLRHELHPNFTWCILFTDESEFTRDGINNFHNQHIWDYENPHATVQSRLQRRFSVNVWAGIVGDHLLGPVFLPPRLNGQAYHHFLVHTLRPMLYNAPIGLRRRMWFMHDGAPPHFAIIVRNLLNR